jgi:hypothetical protein
VSPTRPNTGTFPIGCRRTFPVMPHPRPSQAAQHDSVGLSSDAMGVTPLQKTDFATKISRPNDSSPFRPTSWEPCDRPWGPAASSQIAG